MFSIRYSHFIASQMSPQVEPVHCGPVPTGMRGTHALPPGTGWPVAVMTPLSVGRPARVR